MKSVWDKPRPKSLGKPEKLSKNQKSAAKRFAKMRMETIGRVRSNYVPR